MRSIKLPSGKKKFKITLTEGYVLFFRWSPVGACYNVDIEGIVTNKSLFLGSDLLNESFEPFTITLVGDQEPTLENLSDLSLVIDERV